jgi:phage tail-like protein
VADLVGAFNFEVTLTRTTSGGTATLGDGAFAECSGLELEADVREYLEGGRNDGVVRRVGRVKLVPLVLKRGMLVADGRVDRALWDWISGMVGGTLPIPRYDGLVRVKDAARRAVVAIWAFDAALPSKVTGPRLDARTGEIAMEELHLVHEGLRLVGPS